MSRGGKVAIEWPRNCTYWHRPEVREFMSEFGLKRYEFDGCCYNLRSQVPATFGRLLKKPWTIASNCHDFWRMERCCDHAPHEHVRVQGKDTRLTECYTRDIADSIHVSWLCNVSS